MSFITTNNISVNRYINYDEDDPAFNGRDSESVQSSESDNNESSYGTELNAESDDEASDETDEEDIGRCTLLMHAAQLGQHAIVVALLAAGADATLADPDGDNALVYALESGDSSLPIIIELMKHDADPHHQNEDEKDFFDRIKDFELPDHVCEHLKTLNDNPHIAQQLVF